MKEKETMRFKTFRRASALIMTMVLTVLLAIVAVMFVAVARMDRASTSNIADNKSLDLAAKSITEIISKDLLRDTPGVAGHDPNNYYDYPDPCNPWLASLEPNSNTSKTVYSWLQISDVTNYLHQHGYSTVNVNTDPPGNAKVVREYPDITLTSGNLDQILADADGDGIGDSKWIELKDFACLRSSKGQKIYAAVRVIDNGGMVNVNTAYKFDVNDANHIDGSTQMQINLKGLLKGTVAQINTQITDINNARSCRKPNYEKNVIWNYNSIPDVNYLPYDISDELELRYRYCIDSKFVSRFEVNAPFTNETVGWSNFGHLYNSIDNWGLGEWQTRITDPNFPNDPCADRRHFLTAYNLDRVIDPNGDKMLNVNNSIDPNILRNKIKQALLKANPGLSDANGQAAQIAANLIDFRDSDPNVTVVKNENGTKSYYGFERPCIYITELAYRIYTDIPSGGIKHESYAIELYKPYPTDSDPNKWTLHIDAASYDVNWSSGEQYHIIAWQDASYPLPVIGGVVQDLGPPGSPIFSAGSTISLVRKAKNDDIVVDSHKVPTNWPLPATAVDGNYSDQRDITLDKCIKRLWEDPNDLTFNPPSLGIDNTYTILDANIVAHPDDTDFNSIGRIGMIFSKAAYYNILSPGDITNTIGYPGNLLDKESQVRLNPDNPAYQYLFNYLTVMDPHNYISDVNETRIKGRININTAPASVLAQLPWVSIRKGYNNQSLAKAIVAYRDKTAITGGPDYSTRSGYAGFRTIGQLYDVNLGSDNKYKIDYYSSDVNDFINHDYIFDRISNLVTVRSDIFTAYILVRIGTDGPQKRYMVILDRSHVKNPITDPNNRVKIIAFQPVPQAR